MKKKYDAACLMIDENDILVDMSFLNDVVDGFMSAPCDLTDSNEPVMAYSEIVGVPKGETIESFLTQFFKDERDNGKRIYPYQLIRAKDRFIPESTYKIRYGVLE